MELSLPTIQINGQKKKMDVTVHIIENAVAALNMLWSNLKTHPQSLFPGIYTVTVTNDEGCKAEANVEITELPLPLVNITGKNKVCIGHNG